MYVVFVFIVRYNNLVEKKKKNRLLQLHQIVFHMVSFYFATAKLNIFRTFIVDQFCGELTGD